jgi:hypothetical protein
LHCSIGIREKNIESKLVKEDTDSIYNASGVYYLYYKDVNDTKYYYK